MSRVRVYPKFTREVGRNLTRQSPGQKARTGIDRKIYGKNVTNAIAIAVRSLTAMTARRNHFSSVKHRPSAFQTYRIYAIPATQNSSERTASHVMSDLRTILDPDQLDELLLIRSHSNQTVKSELSRPTNRI